MSQKARMKRLRKGKQQGSYGKTHSAPTMIVHETNTLKNQTMSQIVQEVFVKTSEQYKYEDPAYSVAMIGKYAANYLYAKSTGDPKYENEKLIALLGYIVTLLHFNPVSGIDVSAEVKRDYMVCGESLYEDLWRIVI